MRFHSARNLFAAAAFACALLLPPMLAAETATGADSLVKKLLDGNARYVNNKRIYPDLGDARRADLSKNGQHPFVTVLSCSDSRVAPEHLFDQGIGDLFVVRVAGNVAATDEIGSVEYGTEHLGSALLLVLGHSGCGAVTAVYKGDKVGGSIPELVAGIGPAVNRAKAVFGQDFSNAGLDRAILENVKESVRNIWTKSSIVRDLVGEGKLAIRGGLYHLDSGTVEMVDVSDMLGAVAAAPEVKASAATPIVVVEEPSLVPGVVGESVMVALGVATFLVMFAPATRIKKMKFRTRLVLGLGVFGVLLVVQVPVFTYALSSPWWLVFSGSAVVFVLMAASSAALSKHVSGVIRQLRSR